MALFRPATLKRSRGFPASTAGAISIAFAIIKKKREPWVSPFFYDGLGGEWTSLNCWLNSSDAEFLVYFCRSRTNRRIDNVKRPFRVGTETAHDWVRHVTL
jgi:hypothetical protein